MNFDIFDFVKTWEVSDIQDTEHKKLKNRTIGGKDFQFVRQDVRTRNRMAASLRSVADAMMPLITSGVELYYSSGQEKLSQDDTIKLLKTFLPNLPEKLLSDDLVEFLEGLCAHASVWDESGGKGSFKKLTNPLHYENAFDDDMTLQVPVAITVLEVNLRDGFFDKIIGALPLEQSQTTELKSGSEQSTTKVSPETEND